MLSPKRALALAALTATSASIILWFKLKSKKRPSHEISAMEQLIGNTPLIELHSLSKETGCRILAKVEFVNPGGSVKDRVAKYILREALKKGTIKPGDTIFEGTSGSTGISLAMLSHAIGLNCCIYMPNDQAIEKSELLERLGATVFRVNPVSIVDPQQFCNLAKAGAEAHPNGYYVDQFENISNMRAHFEETGPEIWRQCNGEIDAFVAGAGTGGTIAGVSRYLKNQNADIRVVLADPQGSSLFNRVKRGVLFAVEEKEGKKARHQVDSIIEGVGLNRLTRNFVEASIDNAFRVTDQEAVDMAQFLLRNEGLFVGSSSALNCVGAVKTARQLGPNHTIVTILCDHGQRHMSRFHNAQFLAKMGLTPKVVNDLSFVS